MNLIVLVPRSMVMLIMINIMLNSQLLKRLSGQNAQIVILEYLNRKIELYFCATIPKNLESKKIHF